MMQKLHRHATALKIGHLGGLNGLFFDGGNCLKTAMVAGIKTAKSTSSWWLTLKILKTRRLKTAQFGGDNYSNWCSQGLKKNDAVTLSSCHHGFSFRVLVRCSLFLFNRKPENTMVATAQWEG